MTKQINDSELLLQALIEECRQMVHDVVVPAARAARDDHERRRYLGSAIELVRAGATVGDAIARVRGGAQQSHQRITVDRVVRALPAPGQGEGV